MNTFLRSIWGGALTAAMVVLAGPHLALAAATPPAPYGDRDLTADLSLQDAYHLPSIVIAEASLTQHEEILDGSFTVLNQEPDIISGWQYNLEVWGTGSQEHTLFYRQAVREPRVSASGEQHVISLSYEMPSLPAGDYTFRIQIVTSDGRALGWHDSAVHSAGTDTFVALSSPRMSLPYLNSPIVDTLSGPNVGPAEKFSLHANLTATQDVTLIPVVEVYPFDIARGNAVVTRLEPVQLRAGQTRPLDIPVVAAETPEIYSAYLKLIDPESGETVSSLGEYRWVVRGADAGVFPPRTAHLATKKGEVTKVRIDYVGPGDAETRLTGKLLIQLKDDKGELARLEVPEIALSDAIGSGMADLELSRDAVGTSRLTTTITDDTGNVLDTAEFRLSPTSKPSVASWHRYAFPAILAGVVVLLAAYIGYGVLTKNRVHV